MLSSAELQARLGLKPGAPFSERLVEEDRYRILSAYASKGYLYARVDVERSEEGNSVDLVFRIAEDQMVRVGRIILRGNERTDDHVILREVNVHPGDPYDYGAVLSGQQHIYRLGFFSLVRFEPLHAGEKEYTRDMLLTVEERPAGAVELGVGYGDLDRFRASAEVSYRNLWGQAQFLGLRVAASDIVEQAVVTFREPWFLNRRLEAGVRLAWSDEKRLNADTRDIYYQTRKTEIATGLSRAYNNGLKLSLIYQYENVDNYNVRPAAILSPDDSGRVRVSSITPGVVLDLRDDPFNPRRGSLHGLAVKEALKILGFAGRFYETDGPDQLVRPGHEQVDPGPGRPRGRGCAPPGHGDDPAPRAVLPRRRDHAAGISAGFRRPRSDRSRRYRDAPGRREHGPGQRRAPGEPDRRLRHGVLCRCRQGRQDPAVRFVRYDLPAGIIVNETPHFARPTAWASGTIRPWGRCGSTTDRRSTVGQARARASCISISAICSNGGAGRVR